MSASAFCSRNSRARTSTRYGHIERKASLRKHNADALPQLIEQGTEKLASVPSGAVGGGAPAAAAAPAAGGAAPAAEAAPAAAKEEEKEESDEDMGFGLFD